MAKTRTQMLPGMESSEEQPNGLYSGDKPNELLATFVQNNGALFDDENDTYSVGAFNDEISTTKANKIYNMHTYWSKKPHDAIQQYISHYTKRGDLVLDPFCGSGSTALAAICEGRSAIAIDRSPIATFIASHYCTLYSPGSLEAAFEKLSNTVAKEMSWLYETICDRCDGKATTSYTVYSELFRCKRCLNEVPLFDALESQSSTESGKSKSITICPYCSKTGAFEEIHSRLERCGSIPVVVSYLCNGKCKKRRGFRRHNDENPKKTEYFQAYDLSKLAEIDQSDIPYWYPRHRMMNATDGIVRWGDKWRAGTSSFQTVDELFTKRNLWALALVLDGIREIEHPELRILVSWACLKCSKMMRYCSDGIGRILSGTYYTPPIMRDSHVWSYICEAYGDIKAHHEAKAHVWPLKKSANALISTQSGGDLSALPPDSIDYIFTDPPYGDKEQYGEQNFVWEAWLGFDTSWHGDEIIVNKTRGSGEQEWRAGIKAVMAECFRVLKPGRWLSLCYHDSSEGTWALVQDVMTEVGFVVDSSEKAIFIETSQKTHNQIHADKVTKRDLVLNFRKPKAGESCSTQLFIPLSVDAKTFREMAQQIIVEYLTSHPGSTKDRIYDELVSRLVRRGEMEAHNFDELLNVVAEEVREPVKKNLSENMDANLFGTHEVGRWYVKETADRLNVAEQQKEDAAAQRVERFMEKSLSGSPEADGVHYSDLFEQIVLIPVEERPRRLFENWLPEYFFKTSEGTWRPPTDEIERHQKAAIREAGTLRRMKRFANSLLEGVPVRDQDRPDSARTLAEWIRQSRRAGLYEQGRVMYEKGGLDLDRLDEDEQIEVEDDYRICVKRGSEEDTSKKTKGRKKK